MDGSRRSTHGNAFFAGLGRTKRIVFFDTLLKGLSGEEIEAVLAHELGHFSRGHLWKRMAFMSLMSLALLWALAWLMDHAWFYASLGTSTETTAMALALFQAGGGPDPQRPPVIQSGTARHYFQRYPVRFS